MNKIISQLIPSAVSITSRANPLVASLAKLDQSKYRRQQKLFLAEGVKLSEEAAGNPAVRYVLIRSEDGTADETVLQIAASAPADAQVIVLPESTFQKISTENAPQGIITVMQEMEELHTQWSAADAAEADGQRILIADSVRDPGNLGTMIRTAAAFGYKRMILGGCADIYHPRTVRASMGALFRMRIDLCDDLPEAFGELRTRGHRILAAALTESAVALGTEPLQNDDCIVIGNEGHGVSDAVLRASNAAVKIPMEESAESLNAAGAAAVLMWEYYRSFR